MKRVERSEIVDYVTYEERRDGVRDSAMRAKDARRVHVGPHLTFLFENHETILYQVQEMTRAERMVKEADITHEIETYNELLGGPGEVGCTLLVELDDPAARAEKLTRWLDLPKHLYAKRADGTKAYARYDERQVGDTRVSSVQYLTFEVGSPGPGRRRLRPPGPRAEARGDALPRAEQRAALPLGSGGAGGRPGEEDTAMVPPAGSPGALSGRGQRSYWRTAAARPPAGCGVDELSVGPSDR